MTAKVLKLPKHGKFKFLNHKWTYEYNLEREIIKNLSWKIVLKSQNLVLLRLNLVSAKLRKEFYSNIFTDSGNIKDDFITILFPW